MALKRAVDDISLEKERVNLSPLSADTASQLDILWHDGDPLGVDGTQVGIFEKTNQVSLASFLQSHHGRALETEIGLEVLGDFTDQALEGKFPDQKLGGLLVTSDFTESYSTGPVTMGFLHTTGSWGAFASGLCGQLLTGSLSSGRFTGGLLGTSHVDILLLGTMIPRQSVRKLLYYHYYQQVQVLPASFQLIARLSFQLFSRDLISY